MNHNQSINQLSQWTDQKIKADQAKASKDAVENFDRSSSMENSRTSSMAQLSQWTENQSGKSSSSNTKRTHKKSQPEPVNESFESSRASSMAQLSAWTDAMGKKPAADQPASKPSAKPESKAPKTIVEDEYEDEFEEYEDEFEEDEEEAPVAPAKASSSSKASAKGGSSSSKGSAEVMQKPRETYVPREEDSSASRPVRPSSGRVKKFDMNISFARSVTTDPRFMRFQKIQESGVLDLQIEKQTTFNILPTTPYDFYLNDLRRQPCTKRQIGVPTDIEKRDIEVNTEEITTKNMEMQFSYGDDTDLFNIISEIKLRKGKKEAKGESKVGFERSGQTLLEAANVSSVKKSGLAGENGETEFMADSLVSAGLTTFLQKSSFLCETLLKEDLERKEEGKASDDTNDGSNLQLFNADSKWVTLGMGETDGVNEFIKTRETVALRFSVLQPQLLMSAHPYPTGEDSELDLRPYKGIYCIWDVGNPTAPELLLEGTGQPTCCCFSNTQNFLVVGGTDEGSLHLWDFRESSAIHKDRDSMDLRITKGIRKPCYSTNLILSFSNHQTDGVTNYGENDELQHSSPIVQINSLSSFSSGSNGLSNLSVISQFVSIDQAGLVIFWITSQKQPQELDELGTAAAGEWVNPATDLQRSPWGRVSLVQTRRLHAAQLDIPSSLHFHDSEGSPMGKVDDGKTITTNKYSRNKHKKLLNVENLAHSQNDIILATIPEDLSTVLVTASSGRVLKLSRFGEPPTPKVFTQIHDKRIDLTSETEEKKSEQKTNGSHAKNHFHNEITHFSAVTCMDVRANFSKNHDENDKNPNNDDIAEAKESQNPKKPEKNEELTELLLVGRENGSIDLYQLNSENPIYSWDISCFNMEKRNNEVVKNNSVIMVKWCPGRASAFFAVDSNGVLYFLDLVKNTLCKEELDLPFLNKRKSDFQNKSLTVWNNMIDISANKLTKSMFNFGFISGNNGKKGLNTTALCVRKGNKALLAPYQSKSKKHLTNQDILAEEDKLLRQFLKYLSANTYDAATVIFPNDM